MAMLAGGALPFARPEAMVAVATVCMAFGLHGVVLLESLGTFPINQMNNVCMGMKGISLEPFYG